MRKFFVPVAIAVVAAGYIGTADAQARARKQRDAGPPPVAAEAPAYGGPAYLTPADRARSGWIEGASPYNPEGSSNPQVPNSL